MEGQAAVKHSMETSAPPTPRGVWCPEFHPTREEFSCFIKYIRTVVEPQCKGIGMCKIIPPSGWFERPYELEQIKNAVARPVGQHVAGKKGVFNVDLVERKTMSAAEFRALSDTLGGDEEPNGSEDPDEIERKFWKSLRPTMDAPVYGADIVGSLFGDADAMSWNLSNLKSILRLIDLPGVTQPMLYFGMWRAMFSFHTEDMDLYSINYVHTGKPKFWYAIPPDAAPQLERAAQAMFPEKHHACAQFLRHKTSLISPARLREFGVPYSKAYQKPGEFVITFPATYHQGFNIGFNIAEAVNFGTMHWIPYALKAKVCKCSPDSVRIDMDTFLPKLFATPPIHPDAIEADAWIFSCQCGKYCSSQDEESVVEEPWFECSTCKIWAHVRCIHPDLANVKDESLPQSLLCHRCMPDDGSTDTLGSPKSSKAALGKRKHASPVKRQASKSKTRLESQSPQPLQKAKGSAASSPRRRRALFRKGLFQKGATIQFEDAEARVAAVEGNHIRLHYKGQSTEDDEWLAVGSKELQQRIVAVLPPKTHARKAPSAT